jgi:prevent-host-death family protein
MSSLRPSTDVRPVTEFRAHTSAVIDQMHSTKRPVILTQHGRSTAVLLDPEVYESLIDEIELLRDLAVSEAQIAAGQVVPHEEVARRMREKYSL